MPLKAVELVLPMMQSYRIHITPLVINSLGGGHTHVHTRTHTYVHTHAHTHTHTHIYNTHTDTHTHTDFADESNFK